MEFHKFQNQQNVYDVKHASYNTVRSEFAEISKLVKLSELIAGN